MLTDDQLHAIMPAVPASKRSVMLPFLEAAMTEFLINTPARTAAFVAQLAHESGQLQFMEEIWGPTAAQRRYEPVSDLATRLGNTEVGDGKRFKGRGPIQVTGRANYKRFGDLLRIDLVMDPVQAAKPELGFRIAGLFWSKKGLNELADLVTEQAFREITRRINGGFNGLEDRRRFYDVACQVLQVTTHENVRSQPPALPEEPVFDRGFEVIGTLPAERPARQAARAPKRKPRPARAKKTSATRARKKTATRAKKKAARRAPARKATRKTARKTARKRR